MNYVGRPAAGISPAGGVPDARHGADARL